MVQTTSTISQSGVAESGRLNLDNAAAAGDEIVYVVNDIRNTFVVQNGAIFSIGTGAGSGTAAFVQSCGSVYSTPNPVNSSLPGKVRMMGMTISAGAQVYVGKNDKLFVSVAKMQDNSAAAGAKGDISIAYNGGSSAGGAVPSAALFLDDGAMLSGGGYLGGVADKGAAQTWAANQAQSSGVLQASRTGAISAGNKVKVKVDGDWAVIGDTTTAGVDTVFGNDDEITVGGNIGVFMNTVLRIGDRVHISQTGQNGSGIFVGSGAKMLVGNDASIYARGGLGAGYAGKYSAAIVSIGSGASITLDHQADGILAAEAGAVLTIGDGATINAAMLSVGYTQDPNNGSFISTSGAPSMQIGNNATINLMTEALFDDPTEFQIAQKGYIVLDGWNASTKPAMMSVGSNLNLVGSGISVGDLIKRYIIPNDSARFGSNAGSTFIWVAAAQANRLSFDAGASINLNGGGIEVNGTSDSIVFSGGTINVIGSDGLTSTISNTLSAGWISMGSSFKVLTDSNGVTTLITSRNSGNNSITFGDDFNINLQSNAATGATGNLTADGSQDIYSFGKNLHLNANSIYLGQFSHTYSGSNYTSTPTSVSITFGNNANIMLSGGFIMNSANAMYMSMGDSGNLSIASGFLFNNLDANGAVLIGNNASIIMNNGFNFSNGLDGGRLSIGNSGHIDVGSSFTFSNVGSAGNLQIGNNTELNVKSDFAFTNAASGTMGVGSGANLNIGGSFSIYNNGVLGKVSFGDAATVRVGSNLSVFNNGDNGNIKVGSNDNISVGGGFNFVNTGGAGSINIGASTTIIADNGFGFVNSGVSGAFLAQDNISIKAGGSGFTFVNSGSTGASMTVGNNANFDINGNFQYLNPGSGKSSNAALSVGSSGVFNITSNFIVVGSSAAAIFGAYTSMVVGGNVSMLEDYNSTVASAGYQYGSYTDLSIGSNMSIFGSNIHFNADISNTISVGGNIILMGTAGVWSKGDGGTLNASGISVLGGPDSNGNSIVDESFVVGASNVVTISTGGLLVDVANGQYIQGDNGTLDTLGDITIKGAGTIFSAGNDFVISTHGNGITLDSGAKSFTIGDNAILDADGGIISMGAVSTVGASANNVVIGSNASVNIGGIQYGNATQRVVIADQAHGNLGNITMSGRADKLTIGNDANLSMGNVTLNSGSDELTVGSGATLNMDTLSILSNGTVGIGDNASVSILGNTNLAGASAGITISNNAIISMADLNMQGTGAYTSIGNGATLNTGNITLGADADRLVIGSNASINTGDIVFNAANQLMSIGNGANASFGDVVLMGSGGVANRPTNSIVVGSGSYGANNMTMGVGVRNTLTLGSGAYWSVNNLIFSAIGSAAANSTTLANILLQSGATLIVDNMTGIGLSPTNKVFIRASAGGNVIIHSGFFDTVSNATSANALEVNFTGLAANPAIFEYDGDIQDTKGKLTLRGLAAITDNTKLIFNLGKDTKYTDQNRFRTRYVGGFLIVEYMTVETGEWVNVASFSMPTALTSGAWTGGPAGGSAATNAANILVVQQSDGSYQMTITKCFLSGTHIMTENGERVVEDIAVGDQIVTFKDGKEVLQTIVWVGSMDVDVNNYSNKETLYPIRIKAHAFGLNQPHRDLLVTPEHTIYVDGGLTPARMLVNGRSIIVDKSIEKYTVHHIETIEHSIILSENLLTESYLNTDNKDMFNGEAVNLRLGFNENAGHKSWEEDAAAPLVVAREKVEPIWQRLDRRATQLGFATVERAKTTRDPALCLTTQKGDVIKPVDIQGKVYSFYLPANVRVIGLRSRAAQPAEAVGPFWDDRRMLGVLVSKFTVLGDEAVTVLPSEMSEVSGWYPAEEGRSDRWTKGLAILPQEVSEISNKVRLLKVELTDSSIYLLDEEGDWAKTA